MEIPEDILTHGGRLEVEANPQMGSECEMDAAISLVQQERIFQSTTTACFVTMKFKSPIMSCNC